MLTPVQILAAGFFDGCWPAGVLPSPLSVPSGGGPRTGSLDTVWDCEWSMTSDQPWAQPTTLEGMGAGSVTATFDPNPGPPRTATLTLLAKWSGDPLRTLTTVQVTQAGFAIIPPANEEISYFHTDAIGSVRMITSATGAVLARYDYLPFGTEWTTSFSTTTNNVKFTGQERDPETAGGSWNAQDYFGARSFQNQIGRFTSVDPGHVGGDISDPQSWNGYAYARNNPLAFIDPLGLRPCKITLSGDDAVAAGVADGAHVDGECVDGKAGTGELVFDYTRWFLADLVSSWWALRTAPQDGVMGAPILPIGSIGAGVISSVVGRAGASVATRSTALLTQAAMTVGNRGAVAASREAALEVAEQWVGIGARLIRSRSGQVVGKISADGQRIYRTTSIGKTQPYINLENRATGGNLHVRW